MFRALHLDIEGKAVAFANVEYRVEYFAKVWHFRIICERIFGVEADRFILQRRHAKVDLASLTRLGSHFRLGCTPLDNRRVFDGNGTVVVARLWSGASSALG